MAVELQDSPWVAQGERRGLILDLDAALTVSWETHDEPVQRSRTQRVRGSPFNLLDAGLFVSYHHHRGTVSGTQSSPVLCFILAQSASHDRVTLEVLLCFSLCYFLFATTHPLPELTAAAHIMEIFKLLLHLQLISASLLPPLFPALLRGGRAGNVSHTCVWVTMKTSDHVTTGKDDIWESQRLREPEALQDRPVSG